MTDSVAAYNQAGPAINWSRLGHVYVVGNGKGGVGKTTTTAHIAALVASDGAKTLIIDLNGQGNIAQLLGFAGTEADDNGRSLFGAVTAGSLLQPARNVRPNLDVVPGGSYVRKIGSVMTAEMGSSEDAQRALLALADAVSKIAGNYDLIIIDTPPENPLLLQLALCTARFVIVPMRTDMMSRKGLRELAGEIRRMREHNPYIVLLAVFVFGSGTNSKGIRREVGQSVAQDLGDNADLLVSSFIRQSEAVAQELVKYGLLAHELELEIKNNPKHWDVRSGKAAGATKVSETSRLVAEDFAKLAEEVLTRAATRRQKMIEQGDWP